MKVSLKLLALERLVDLAVILAVAVMLFWASGISGIIDIGDRAYPLFPMEEVRDALTTWDQNFFVGGNNLNNILSLPVYILLSALEIIGFPLSLAQRMYYVGIFVLAGAGMYLLAGEIASTISAVRLYSKRVASIVAALYYIMNPITQIFLYGVSNLDRYWLMYALLPLSLYFIIKGIRSETIQEQARFAIGVGFSSACILTVDPFFTIIFPIIACLFFVVSIAYHRIALRSWIIFGSLVFVSVILINVFWILPFLGQLSDYISGEIYKNVVPGYFTPLELYKIFSQNLRPASIIGFQEGTGLIITVSNFIRVGILLLAWLTIIIHPRKPFILLLSLNLMVSTLLRTGNNIILGRIYEFLIVNIPILSNLSTIHKYGYLLPLSMSPLLGITVARLVTARSIPKSLRKCAIPIIIVLLLMNSPIMLSGFARSPYGGPVEIPSYYYDARSWLDQQNGFFRTLVIPQVLSVCCPDRYIWAPNQTITALSYRVFTKPVIGGIEGGSFWSGYWFVSNVYNSIFSNVTTKTEVQVLLNMLCVRYLLLSEDKYNPVPATGNLDYSAIQRRLINYGMNLSKSFGPLKFYQNPAFQCPLIYATNKIVILNTTESSDTWEAFVRAINSGVVNATSYFNYAYTNATSLPFDLDSSGLDILNIDASGLRSNPTTQTSLSTLSYVLISPTSIMIRVNTTAPAILVLQEGYDPYWEAYDSAGTLLKHFPINFYANGWFLNKTGQDTVYIRYSLQVFYSVGLVVSSVGVVLALSYVLVDYSKRIRRARK